MPMPSQKATILIIILSYVSFVILGLMDGLLGVAWPSMRMSFDLPIDAFGLLLTTSMLGHITASFANGRLITKAGPGGLLILSASFLTIGAITEILATVWLMVLLGGFFIGLGMGMLDAGMNTYAAATFRPRLLNWLHASFGLGATAGASLMTAYLASGLEWRSGVGTLGALYFGLTLIFVVTRKRWVYAPEHDTAVAPTPYAKNRQTLRLPLVWLSIAIFFIYTGVEIGVGHWAFTLFTEGRGISEATAGSWVTIYWSSFLAGRLLLGFIESNLVRLIRFGMAGAVVGTLLLTFSTIPALGLVGLVIIGVSVAPIFPALVTMTPARVGQQHAPNSIGFEIGAAGFGGAVVPGLAGVLGDSLGLEIIPWFLLTTAVLQLLLHELLVWQSGRSQKDQGTLPGGVM